MAANDNYANIQVMWRLKSFLLMNKYNFFLPIGMSKMADRRRESQGLIKVQNAISSRCLEEDARIIVNIFYLTI